MPAGILLAGILCGAVRAQSARQDSLWALEMREVVVTATRTATDRERVPMPTRVLDHVRASERGATRLSELLHEVPGLRIVRNQFGAGLQLRGLDPAYTLILIDGQPITARLGGTVDLDRLSLDQVERVEVVKGPSSSLYGSEALAGVVNLITRAPRPGMRSQVGYRGETHDTSRLNLGLSGGTQGLTAFVQANRFASGGYDLLPGEPGATSPGFTDLSLSGGLKLALASDATLRVTTRGSRVTRSMTAAFGSGASQIIYQQRGGAREWEGTMDLTGRARGTRYRLTGFGSVASNYNDLFDPANPDQPGRTDFRSPYGKVEGQLDRVLGTAHHVALGGGLVIEEAQGARIADGNRRSGSGFLYAQHQFDRGGAWELVSSVRLDRHSDYGTHISPKVAALTRWGRTIFRASLGTGFKAPTFQQLFIDFSNPGSGYSVVGVSELNATLRRMEAAGQLAYYVEDASTMGALRPERALSADLSAERSLGGRLRIKAGLFATRLLDMIETQPVAATKNGQFVYSYLNLTRVRVAGAEAEVEVDLSGRLGLAAEYQFLQAVDLDVLHALSAGSVYGRRNGRDVRLSRKDYGGLFGRSPHTVSIALSGSHGPLLTSIRGIFRSSYGLADQNGNLILDAKDEFAPGHLLINATLTWQRSNHLALQAGVNNLTGVTHPDRIPSLSGRILYVGLNLNLDTNQ